MIRVPTVPMKVKSALVGHFKLNLEVIKMEQTNGTNAMVPFNGSPLSTTFLRMTNLYPIQIKFSFFL